MTVSSTTELNWFWVVLAATIPMLLGLAAAWPIWMTGQPILGNIAGSIIIFGAAIGFIMREHNELDRLVQACIEAGTTCWPTPTAFSRFAIYAFIALADVIALFTISTSVDARRRRRDYAPEWR